jgi:hypothetical protein
MNIYGDIIEMYHALFIGFDGKFGCKQATISTRIICGNTWARGLSESESTQNHGRGQLYSGKHNEVNHMRDLGLWLSHVQKQAEESVAMTQSLFCKMEETPMTVDEAFGLTKKIYPNPDTLPVFMPEQIRLEKQEDIDEKIEKAEASRDLVMELFKGAGIAISRTAKGLFDSTTEAENHHKPSKKDITSSLLIGNRQGIMEHAMAEITSWVNKS